MREMWTNVQRPENEPPESVHRNAPRCLPILQAEIRSQRPETAYGRMQRQKRRGGNRATTSKERDRKSELVLRSTYQIFEWDRNNSDRIFYNVVRYVHIPLVP